MGFVNFVAEAGKALASGKVTDEDRAAEIKKLLADMLGIKGRVMDVSVKGMTATVAGRLETQEEKEKVILAVGNVAGIAKVEDKIEVEDAAPPAKFRTVAKGDTLSAIAKDEYGDANKYMAIFKANQPMLKDPDKIYPGQVLRIPPQA